MVVPEYKTDAGAMYVDHTERVIDELREMRPQLIFTSPPYRQGPTWDSYLWWLRASFQELASALAYDGSLVVVLGNEWVPPAQIPHPLMALREILAPRAHGPRLYLCQQFVLVHDEPVVSASVKGDVEQLIERGMRVPNKHSHAWWFSRDPDASSVYRRGYESSVVKARSGPDQKRYLEECGAPVHSALPSSAPAFFIDLLTEPGELVLDPYAGSNSTGFAADQRRRRWVSIEKDPEIARGSMARWGAGEQT